MTKFGIEDEKGRRSVNKKKKKRKPTDEGFSLLLWSFYGISHQCLLATSSQ